ncbi:MAG: YraN family protein [Flavobacteriaceae bacterium]|jgi:putative endonuclease|nr:YraN family protein [Flavobacteriaceae bacterium]MDP4674293.1 YraN family protein [Flavobacteriaceae bacterium]MDP4754139.1 YraN family protein [Flavobacteriaceae bacterium]MDP4794115.1 YraN family protein [Flavobacteriaceae bacterium]MDP4885549.1 YraN family protein [Flavobacteriaceae bacterium]
MSTQYLGQWGEDLAATHLMDHGYVVLQRNYRYDHAEIDLIVQGFGYLVFVEVRTRKGVVLIDPLSSVDKKKQRHLIRAANYYALTHLIDEALRFDVIAISLQGTSVHLEHIEDAFLFF